MNDYINRYLNEVKSISNEVDQILLNKIIERIVELKENKGRIFFLGVGGSAANCSHAVNDFRKIAQIEYYSPIDNVAELTARTNDEGWDTVFSAWLERSNLNQNDLIFILSVGGGNKEKKISVNIISAIEYAKKQNCDIVGIIGRDGGYVAQNSNLCLIIPTQSADTITPHAESWQAVIWHLMVTDPRILSYQNKWESFDKLDK